MSYHSPNPVPVTIYEARTALPFLRSFAAGHLKAAGVFAAPLIAHLEAGLIGSGDRLATLEQNWPQHIEMPDALENFWRVLCAYEDTATGRADQIYPWMYDLANDITVGAAA